MNICALPYDAGYKHGPGNLVSGRGDGCQAEGGRQGFRAVPEQVGDKVIRQKVADEWPPQVAALAGAWPDLPEAEELRHERRQDAPRENL
jgi:hypothetical protein